MATPRVKRPFTGAASDPSQRQITSFFACDGRLASPSSTTTATERANNNEPTTPLLPPSVQANLLAVGMRVRKSVPEGYKTKTNDDSDGRRLENNRRMSATTTTMTTTQASSGRPPFASSLRTTGAPYAATPPPPTTLPRRELLPFCGLHKVGGLSVQPCADSDEAPPLFAAPLFRVARGVEDDMDNDAVDDDEPPSLTSSQDTVSSTASDANGDHSRFSHYSRGVSFSARAPPGAFQLATGKRSYEDEGQDTGQDEEDGYQTRLVSDGRYDHERVRVHEDGEVNNGLRSGVPTTANGTLLTPFYQQGRRVLAVPRSRQQRPQHAAISQPPLQPLQGRRDPVPAQTECVRLDVAYGVDQENVDVLGDFDEADFLDASVMAGVGGQHDLEMSGV
ncbi:ribonucleotide reductase inhibitor [Niveomyces insectorum RCEF 264]|uniref:Ribonucleotide reductase inhibitor n=1 Tax=Niveomyces insectorum RCEF 264 TaxID=1081102 RepID=A0A167UM79_9HYPO|nr:ribonucleotide reductase inhibitor [Niveomyces insectorum RCEF 264]